MAKQVLYLSYIAKKPRGQFAILNGAGLEIAAYTDYISLALCELSLKSAFLPKFTAQIEC